MNQIQFTTYGNASVLQWSKTETPKPAPGEVLIKVGVAGVNYSDILRRKNTYFMPTPLPYVPGSEAIGEIVEMGEEVPQNGLQSGSRVLAILPWGGGYSEYAIAKADYCIPLPPQLDDRKAAALFVQGTTACLLVHKVVGKLVGKTVLIHAASGGVGSLLIQLAKLEGAKVIAASSSAEKLEFAQSLGADIGVDYSRSGWTNDLLEKNGGKKVDYIFEMVGGRIYEACIDVLTPGGSLVVFGAASGERGNIHSERFVDENLHLLSFNLAHFMQNRFEEWQEALGEMIRLLTEKIIQVHTPQAFPLHQAAQAHTAIESRETKGKVILYT